MPSIELSIKKTKKNIHCNFEFPAPYVEIELCRSDFRKDL